MHRIIQFKDIYFYRGKKPAVVRRKPSQVIHSNLFDIEFPVIVAQTTPEARFDPSFAAYPLQHKQFAATLAPYAHLYPSQWNKPP